MWRRVKISEVPHEAATLNRSRIRGSRMREVIAHQGYLSISGEAPNPSSAHHDRNKPDQYCQSYELWDPDTGFAEQYAKHALRPVGKVYAIKGQAQSGP